MESLEAFIHSTNQTCVFQGAPGSGKTTYVLQTCRQIDDRFQRFQICNINHFQRICKLKHTPSVLLSQAKFSRVIIDNFHTWAGQSKMERLLASMLLHCKKIIIITCIYPLKIQCSSLKSRVVQFKLIQFSLTQEEQIKILGNLSHHLIEQSKFKSIFKKLPLREKFAIAEQMQFGKLQFKLEQPLFSMTQQVDVTSMVIKSIKSINLEQVTVQVIVGRLQMCSMIVVINEVGRLIQKGVLNEKNGIITIKNQ